MESTLGTHPPKGLHIPKWIALPLIIGAGLLIYAQVAGFDFVYYDDDEYIFNNPQVKRGLTAENLGWALTALVSKHWHPVTWLSHMLDVQLFGLNPAGHHLMNLGLHLLTALLLYRFLLITTEDRVPALVAALLLTVHPLHVENVAWVADRKDLLCALFWMVTLNAYAEYVRRPSLLGYMGVLLAFCMAALSKSMALTLPLVLILMDVWPLQRYGLTASRFKKESRQAQTGPIGFRRLFSEKILFFALSFAFGLVTLYALNSKSGSTVPAVLPNIDLRLFQGVSAYLEYLVQLIYPTQLITPYQVSIQVPLWKPVLSGFVILLTTAAAIRLFRRFPYFTVGWAWYLVTLLPVAGFHGPIRIADRYAYIPLIGIYMLLSWCFATVFRQQPRLKRPLLILVAASIGTLSVLAYQQTAYWKNTLALFQHTLAVDARIAVAHSNLGVYYQDHDQLDVAIRHQMEAVKLAPERPEYHYNLGVHHLHRQDYRQARQHFARATALGTDYVAALSNLGLCHLQMGELKTARKVFEKVLASDPDHLHTNNHLGRYYLRKGDLQTAEIQFRRMLRTHPENGDVLANLASTLAAGNNFEMAEHYFRKAIGSAPVKPGYYYGLAAVLTHQKKFSDAAGLRLKGLAQDPQNGRQHYFIAVDYYFSNDFQNSEKHLSIAKELKYAGVESMFEQNLDRARAGATKQPEGRY